MDLQTRSDKIFAGKTLQCSTNDIIEKALHVRGMIFFVYRVAASYTSIVLEYSRLKYIAHERANLSFKSLYGDHVISKKKKKSVTQKLRIIAILKYTSGVNI